MRRAGLMAAAMVAVVALAPARRAEACGDSGGGGDSSSSSSSAGDGGGGSYDSTPSVPACEDASTVVGYRECAPYGTWSTLARLPRLSLDVGTWSTRVDLDDVAVGGSVTHDDGPSYAYRITGDDLGEDADAVGVRLRVLGHLGAVYLGLEGGVGGVVAGDTRRLTPMTGVDLTSEGAAVAMGGLVVGGRVTSGRLAIGGEVLAGVRGVAVASTSVHGDCVIEELAWSSQPTVEVRARGELWLTPWITAGAYLGRDALGGQTSAGLDLGLHLRAFDGR